MASPEATPLLGQQFHHVVAVEDASGASAAASKQSASSCATGRSNSSRTASGCTEHWTDESAGHGAISSTLTAADALAMEWDYSHVVQALRRNSILSEFSDMDMDEEEGALLDPFYDITSTRLHRLFQHFASSEGQDRVSVAEFEHGLAALDISPPTNATLEAFARKIDTDGDGWITLSEFTRAVQLVKLAHLCQPDDHAPHPPTPTNSSGRIFPALRVVDYSPTHIHKVEPVTQVESFMFSTTPSWASVRWVHHTGFKADECLNLRRLAIRYQLHPLALEDCLNHSDVLRCKFELYDDHAFVCVPVLRAMDGRKRAEIEALIRQHRHNMFAKDQAMGDGSEASMSDDGGRSGPVVAAKMSWQKKRQGLTRQLDSMRVLMRKPQQLCMFVMPQPLATVLTVQNDHDVSLWQNVLDGGHVHKSYSKLRSHDQYFLVTSILNAVVDDMMPLATVFEPKLKLMGKLLRLERTKFNSKRLTKAKKLLVAIDKVVRPMLDLVQGQLMHQTEFNQGEVRNHLRDVRDLLKQMAVEIKDHHQALAELVEEDKQIRAQQKDNVLYVLSVAAALFLPGTFMTGLYGMNFDNMPELHTQYGYFIWWGALLAIVAGTFYYLKAHKHWI